MSTLQTELAMLSASGQTIALPAQHLSHYPEIKSLLEKASGRYVSRRKEFVFEDGIDVPDVLRRLVAGETINHKQEHQFFATPEAKARELVDYLELQLGTLQGKRILEPSAGDGRMADLARARGAEVVTIEAWSVNAQKLRAKGYDVIERDFLTVTPEEIGEFDGVLANPPFTKDQDIAHFRHMCNFVRPGGAMAVITSPAWYHGRTKAHVEFREFLDTLNVEPRQIPAGTFKESGTGTATMQLEVRDFQPRTRVDHSQVDRKQPAARKPAPRVAQDTRQANAEGAQEPKRSTGKRTKKAESAATPAGPENRAKNIVSMMNTLGRRHGAHKVFRDFVTLAACAISNSVDKAKFEEREKMYMDTVRQYEREEVQVFPQMLAELVMLFEEGGMSDALGKLYMQLDLGNSSAGQYWTPYEVCKMMAKISYFGGGDDEGTKAKVKEKGFVRISDPTSGGGAMLIAFADAMHEEGINYQQHMHASAIDLDFTAAMISYVQLSLLHIPAVVQHGNSLSMETYSTWFTPAHIMGNWSYKLRRREQEDRLAEEAAKAEADAAAALAQEASVAAAAGLTAAVEAAAQAEEDARAAMPAEADDAPAVQSSAPAVPPAPPAPPAPRVAQAHDLVIDRMWQMAGFGFGHAADSLEEDTEPQMTLPL